MTIEKCEKLQSGEAVQLSGVSLYREKWQRQVTKKKHQHSIGMAPNTATKEEEEESFVM